METAPAQRIENIQALTALYQAQLQAQATEKQKEETILKLIHLCYEGIALRCSKVEQFSQKQCMIETIKDSIQECKLKLSPEQESLLSDFCEWRANQFEKKESQEEQKKTCQGYLVQSIGPFVKELLQANTPKEIEIIRKKLGLDKKNKGVVQQLTGRFLNPVELVWFDPQVHNDENKGYTKTLREELNIKVNTFTEFEEAVHFIQNGGRDRRILVICCGSMGERLCERINMDINVIFVYIFAFYVAKHRQWAPKYYKIQGIYTNILELLRSIKSQEFFESQASAIFKRSTESFAFFKALHFFKEWAEDQQMSEQVKSLDVLESLLHIQSLNDENILVPHLVLGKQVFEEQQIYEKKIESDNYEEIIKMYTRNDVFRKLNAQLRFSKRDMFLLSAQIIARKISNALMKVQKDDPGLVFAGACYRGMNIKRRQLNQFTEHLKNIITFSAFTSSSVSQKVAISFMLGYSGKFSVKVEDSDQEEVKEVDLDEKVPILLKFNVTKETAMQSIITKEELKDDAKKLEDKLRPTNITKFSQYETEGEVLFAPLSSFKIDGNPIKVKHESGLEYYQINLEYVDTFIPTKQMLFMNVTNAFSQLKI